MAKNVLLKKEFDFFQDKGFLIKRKFIKNEEIEKIINTIKKDSNFKSLFNKGDKIILNCKKIINRSLLLRKYPTRNFEFSRYNYPYSLALI